MQNVSKESYSDVSQCVIKKIIFYVSFGESNGSNLLMVTFYI